MFIKILLLIVDYVTACNFFFVLTSGIFALRAEGMSDDEFTRVETIIYKQLRTLLYLLAGCIVYSFLFLELCL